MTPYLVFVSKSLKKSAGRGNAASRFRAEKLDPPAPGEKCKLCGQVCSPAKVDDETTAVLLGLELSQSAGLSSASTRAIVHAKLPLAELRRLAKLSKPELRTALLARASESAWSGVIAAGGFDRPGGGRVKRE
jgi:hypothetical protein